jgi:hypothetical protein
MKLENKNLENFLKKAEEDPQLMEILKGIVYYCQAASEMGIPIEEIAAAGTTGYTIGQDPKLKEMLKHLIKMSEMGLGTEH